MVFHTGVAQNPGWSLSFCLCKAASAVSRPPRALAQACRIHSHRLLAAQNVVPGLGGSWPLPCCSPSRGALSSLTTRPFPVPCLHAPASPGVSKYKPLRSVQALHGAVLRSLLKNVFVEKKLQSSKKDLHGSPWKCVNMERKGKETPWISNLLS